MLRLLRRIFVPNESIPRPDDYEEFISEPVMMGFAVSGRKSGGAVTANMVRQLLEAPWLMDPLGREKWWQQSVIEELRRVEVRPANEDARSFERLRTSSVGEREREWHQLLNSEVKVIIQRLDLLDSPSLGPGNLWCMRALVMICARNISLANDQTWANEWRFYAEALRDFGSEPFFPVAPSFTGKIRYRTQ